MEKPIQFIGKEMPEEISFGKWLRQRRRTLDLTQKALAKQVGCAEITVRQIEGDIIKPSKELAEALLERLDISEFERPGWIGFARGTSGYPSKTKSRSSQIDKKTNLPIPLTSFVGHENDVQRVEQRLAKHRLVTLIGVGGIGKTRLSQQVGRQVLEDYADGVWLIELASLTDPMLVPQTVALVFGIQSQSDHPITERLIQALRGRTALLILDNCEHLLDACAQLADNLLKHCPNLKILATGREALGVIGEALYQVPSLTIPEIQRIALVEKLNDYESIRLFDERAQLVQMDFALTTENAFSVAHICSRLDGIPLAIELAAVRIQTLSAEQIAKQLDQCFHILTGGSRTALPKHRTLQACIDWSWNLLSDSEQTVLSRLSVFAGGFTLGAAEQVCAGEGIESHQVSGLTTQLVQKSLVVENRDSGNEQRYRLLETIRQYAREKLIESGQEERICTRHMHYFLHLSELAEPALRGPAQIEWMVKLNAERDNIRAALTWADKTDVEAGLYISSRFGRFWESFDIREENDWLSTFLQKPESHAYPGARAMALYTHLGVLNYLNQRDTWRSTADECLELCRALGNQSIEMDIVLMRAGNISSATQRGELFQKAIKLAQTSGDIWRQARTLHQVGWNCGDDERLAYWKRAVPLFRQAGDLRSLAELLSNTGYFALLNTDLELAQKSLDEATVLNDRLKDKLIKAEIVSAYAQLATITGEYDQAHIYLQEGLEIIEELGNRLSSLFARTQLAYLALREGNLTEARDIFTETAREFFNDKNEIGVVFNLEGIAGLCVAIGNPEIAAQLIGWADATRKKLDNIRPRFEQADVDKIIAACLEKMGEVTFSDAYEEGQKMTMDEAVVYALEESDL